jgi:hypothetical protein
MRTPLSRIHSLWLQASPASLQRSRRPAPARASFSPTLMPSALRKRTSAAARRACLCSPTKSSSRWATQRRVGWMRCLAPLRLKAVAAHATRLHFADLGRHTPLLHMLICRCLQQWDHHCQFTMMASSQQVRYLRCMRMLAATCCLVASGGVVPWPAAGLLPEPHPHPRGGRGLPAALQGVHC